jgi:hypothetical protein
MAYLYKQKVWWKRLLGAFLIGLPISAFVGIIAWKFGWLSVALLVAPATILAMIVVGMMLMDGTL